MRKLKVYNQSIGGGNYTSDSTILLKGKWLEEAGFKMGEYVAVEIEGDKWASEYKPLGLDTIIETELRR